MSEVPLYRATLPRNRNAKFCFWILDQGQIMALDFSFPR